MIVSVIHARQGVRSTGTPVISILARSMVLAVIGLALIALLI